MIKPGEINKKAHGLGVRDQQIEKDYILSWILWGISQHDVLSKCFVFKGGTVLKKVYFEDYRFSEDLDFTLRCPDISNADILKYFNNIFAEISKEANIPLKILPEVTSDDEGLTFYIGYTGPLGGHGGNKSVKIDISRSEKMEFEPILQPAIISYTDLEPYNLLCYPLAEVFIEKMRTIQQRTQARDLYDIWYLMEYHDMELNEFIREYLSKCELKGIDGTKLLPCLEEKLDIFKGQWNKALQDQIKDLPDFDQVVREVRRAFKRISF